MGLWFPLRLAATLATVTASGWAGWKLSPDLTIHGHQPDSLIRKCPKQTRKPPPAPHPAPTPLRGYIYAEEAPE